MVDPQDEVKRRTLQFIREFRLDASSVDRTMEAGAWDGEKIREAYEKAVVKLREKGYDVLENFENFGGLCTRVLLSISTEGELPVDMKKDFYGALGETKPSPPYCSGEFFSVNKDRPM